MGLKGELDRLAHQARPTRGAGCASAARGTLLQTQLRYQCSADAYEPQILEMGGTLNLGAGGGPGMGGGGLGLGGGMPRVGSMPRVPSAERLTKRLRDESPAADSPRGFVPFRSLRSYENLLSLQAVRHSLLCPSFGQDELTRAFFVACSRRRRPPRPP